MKDESHYDATGPEPDPTPSSPEVEQFEDYVLAVYGEVVLAHGEGGAKRPEAIDEMMPEIEEAVRRGRIKLPANLRDVVRRVVERADVKTSRKQPETLRYVLDVINGLTILGSDHPILDEVCVIGSGVRRAWRFVSIGDLNGMMRERSELAKAVVEATADFIDTATQIVDYLVRHYGAAGMLGDIAS